MDCFVAPLLAMTQSKIVGRKSEAPSAIFCDVPLTVPARIKMADGATLIRPTNTVSLHVP
jgi:hypothetical protein